jgi:hypothetical protein
VEQGIQTRHNVSDRGGAQRAQYGVGEFYTGLVDGRDMGSRWALTTPFRLVHVDDPVREKRLVWGFVIAHPRVGPGFGVFRVALVQTEWVGRRADG